MQYIWCDVLFIWCALRTHKNGNKLRLALNIDITDKKIDESGEEKKKSVPSLAQ